MPEHSLLHARLPPEAMHALQGALDDGLGAGNTPLLDLRNTVPDSGFTDITHVNAEGRMIVSQLLAARINQSMPQGRPPLMRQH